MSHERWRRVEDICHDALERPTNERAAFLREACGHDDTLRAEVESLLANASAAEHSGLGIRDLGLELIGTQVGVYRIESLLGAGGMGEVYRARDTKLGRNVAIKILPAGFLAHSDRVARFEREARLLATLNHPNIGAIYGFEEAGETRALVLELIEGETLAERVSRSAIAIDEALHIARAIAEALEAAHEKGIVHRDLKPANIKITPAGVVKVLDFGLGKAVSGDEHARDLSQSPTVTVGGTQSGLLLGTAAYMSPDQARGRVVDKRADVWAFGCVMYEMLAGRRAFEGESISDTIVAVLERTPDWNALPARTPPGVRRLLRRCLEKNLLHRLHDIADARIEIDDTLKGADTPAPDPAARTGRHLRSSLVAISFVAVIAVVALALLFDARSGTADAGAAPPVFSRVVRLTSGPAREFAPAISPDGKWVAYLSNASGRQDVWIKFIAGGDAANLTASAGLEVSMTAGVGGPAISADGTRVAVAARVRGSLSSFAAWEIPAPLPGQPRRLLKDGFYGLRWSPDGKGIAYIRAGTSAGDALWVADVDGTNPREIIKAQNGMHVHWPAWSRDGFIYFMRTFATVSNLDQTEIYRVRESGGPIEVVVATPRRAMYPFPLADGGLLYSANPDSADLSLWWRSASGGQAQRLTTGVGDYIEPRASDDGRTIVLTLNEQRQALVRISVDEHAAPIAMITDGYGSDLDPNLAPSGDRIVFSSARTGDRHVWSVRPDGTDARSLTTGSSTNDRPVYSPDGGRIAFISDRGGRRAIWVIDADGGAPRKLVDASPTGGLSWSRDGRQIIWAQGEGSWPSLAAASVGDGAIHKIPTPGVVAEPAWSPARDVIAYLSPATTGPAQQALAFVDGNGKPLYTSIPGTPGEGAGFLNGMLAWSPDGTKLALAEQNTNAEAAIWLLEPDAKTPSYRKIVNISDGGRIRGMTWSADGAAIIIGRHDVASDIVLMRPDQ
jgi:serine/threonine protein kinase/Tol biopolymer transport system component